MGILGWAIATEEKGRHAHEHAGDGSGGSGGSGGSSSAG
mgnify:CR=1 FL=1